MRIAWIETVAEQDADEELGSLYARVKEPGASDVDHVLAVHSLHPRGLAAHYELYRAVMAGTATLRKVERELIALVVSRANGCHY